MVDLEGYSQRAERYANNENQERTSGSLPATSWEEAMDQHTALFFLGLEYSSL